MRRARSIVRDVLAITEQPVMVLLSGGKDSGLTLHLLRERAPASRVVGLHLEIVPGLQYVRRVLTLWSAKYGVRIIFRPHPLFAFASKHGLLGCRVDERLAGAALVKRADIVAEALRAEGCDWQASGERASDSLQRAAMLSSLGNPDEERKRCYPIANFQAGAVRSLVRRLGIPTVTPLRTGNRGGLDFRHTALRALHDRHPDDWARFVRVYPHAPALLASSELAAA